MKVNLPNCKVNKVSPMILLYKRREEHEIHFLISIRKKHSRSWTLDFLSPFISMQLLIYPYSSHMIPNIMQKYIETG